MFWFTQSKHEPFCRAACSYRENSSQQRWSQDFPRRSRKCRTLLRFSLSPSSSWQRLSHQMITRTPLSNLSPQPNQKKKLIPGTREFGRSNRIPFPWSWYHQTLSKDLQPGNPSLSIDYPAIMGYNCSRPIPRTLKCCAENTLMHL